MDTTLFMLKLGSGSFGNAPPVRSDVADGKPARLSKVGSLVTMPLNAMRYSHSMSWLKLPAAVPEVSACVASVLVPMAPPTEI